MNLIKISLNILFVLALCVAGYAQFTNCTNITMVKTGESTKCTIPYPHYKWTAYPLSDNVTYQDSCSNYAAVVYYTAPSSISGAGGCMYGGDNTTLNQCGMSVETNPVYSLIAGVPNAMYLEGWDQIIKCITSGGFCTGNGYTCERQGSFQQDIKYCDVSSCPKCTGCGTCQGCRPPGCSSPVVIDLLDEGMHFTSLSDGVRFDLNGDGKPLYLSWTDPNYHNAWLALDRNGNGTIDNVQELFGYLTEPQLRSPDGKRTGWLALAVYDQPSYGGNGDGVIDANDAIYPKLLLWIDTNHDGISQPDELHHLAEMGVTSIPLEYTHKSYKDENGNNFQFENFVSIRQEHHQAWDVVLNAAEVLPSFGGFSRSPDVLCKRAPGPLKYFISYNEPLPYFLDFTDCGNIVKDSSAK
jgi:hypothetical protein